MSINLCETVLKVLRQTPPRSVALLGGAGVGKSSLVRQLVYRLSQPDCGWRVLRVSPSDFMAGTKYLGEWETKVKELVEAIRKPRRVLLYIPNPSDLAAAGTWSKSDSSVATALAPYLDDGSVVVLGESTPEEFERGLGKIASLRRLFEKVLLLEPDLDRTRDMLIAIRDEERSRISNEVLGQLLEVSSQFLSHIHRPGDAVELLRTVVKAEKSSGLVPAFRDILDALSRSTGIPSDLLDDSVPLNQAQTKEFFESKIIGQSKAVEAVVDLVTLIKAGAQPSPTPTYTFQQVGTQIDGNAALQPHGRYKVRLTVTERSVIPAAQATEQGARVANVPTFRNVVFTSNIFLADGQTTQFSSATDKSNGEVFKADVSLTVEK